MTDKEIVDVMSKPISSARVSYYRIIYKLATGKEFKGCLCGNGANRLFKTCKIYADKLKKNIKN